MNEMQEKSCLKKRLLTRSMLTACLLAFSGISFVTPRASAQVITASLSGTVTDPTGAVIPNATVLLRNDLSGDKRTIKTNGAGFFTFAGVSSGDFSIAITAPGFGRLTELGFGQGRVHELLCESRIPYQADGSGPACSPTHRNVCSCCPELGPLHPVRPRSCWCYAIP
jgi:hypothetical protein